MFSWMYYQTENGTTEETPPIGEKKRKKGKEKGRRKQGGRIGRHREKWWKSMGNGGRRREGEQTEWQGSIKRYPSSQRCERVSAVRREHGKCREQDCTRQDCTLCFAWNLLLQSEYLWKHWKRGWWAVTQSITVSVRNDTPTSGWMVKCDHREMLDERVSE